MITELKIDGFKSFGSPGVHLKLGRLNFLVGANASGKTNLLLAMKFLRAVLKDDVADAWYRFGATEIPTKDRENGSHVQRIRLSLETRPPYRIPPDDPKWSDPELRYQLDIESVDVESAPVIRNETLRTQVMQGKKLRTLTLSRVDRSVEIEERGDIATSFETSTIPEQERSRSALGLGLISIPLALLRTDILQWQFFHIDPSLARQESSLRAPSTVTLGPSGENLALVLHTLRSAPEERDGFESVLHGLRGAIQGFTGLGTKRDALGNKVGFDVLEEGFKDAFDPSSVSDGTIHLLALSTVTAWTSHRSTLICIEEPERGLHPHLSEHIVEILRTAAEHSQVIATTHSPNLLDYLEPQEVFLFDKKDGVTHVRQASDVEDIQAFRKHFRLGELWEQGALGGTL